MSRCMRMGRAQRHSFLRARYVLNTFAYKEKARSTTPFDVPRPVILSMCRMVLCTCSRYITHVFMYMYCVHTDEGYSYETTCWELPSSQVVDKCEDLEGCTVFTVPASSGCQQVRVLCVRVSCACVRVCMRMHVLVCVRVVRVRARMFMCLAVWRRDACTKTLLR